MSFQNTPIYDMCVIGGGINGTGIARDAAGRGLSVILIEKSDLASATSSASTKLIHGGLRYLEQYEFKLVREALTERERLLKAAPHIIWPLEFILPHEPHLRPAWMIRSGLFLYDYLGKRDILPSSHGVKMQGSVYGDPLHDNYKRGFSYADCWVEDSRMVVLNARDAADKAANIRTRTECTSIRMDNGLWSVTMKDGAKNTEETIRARSVVNAAGPWVRTILEGSKLSDEFTPAVRLSKGSHIILPQLYGGNHAYILQQPDGRIVFAIPYEQKHTLVGTTDVEYSGDPSASRISEEEITYLLKAVNRSFKNNVKKEDILWTYSGVRPLLDNGNANPAEVTRDYKIDLDDTRGAPIISLYGGKLTTYRAVSEHVVNTLRPYFPNMKAAWTKNATLPGGDIFNHDFNGFLKVQTAQYKNIDPQMIKRLARAYGTRIENILGKATHENDLGDAYGDTVFEAELRYLVRQEWARSAEDILWRRSKLGLHISEQTKANIESALPKILSQEIAP